MKENLVAACLTLAVIFLFVSCEPVSDSGGGEPKETIDLNRGLVAWYPLNGNASDMSSFGNNGIIVGQTAPAPDRSGTANRAMSFNGQSDYIQIGDVAPLKVQSAVSVSAWIYPQSTGSWDAIAGKWTPSGNSGKGYLLLIRPDTRRIQWQIDGMAVQTDAPLVAGRWTNVTAVYNGDSLSVYLDGEIAELTEEDNEYTGGIGDHSTPFRMGNVGFDSDLYYFNGRLDEVLIYNRALNGREAEALAN